MESGSKLPESIIYGVAVDTGGIDIGVSVGVIVAVGVGTNGTQPL